MKHDPIGPITCAWLAVAASMAHAAPPGVAQSPPPVNTDLVITYNVALSLSGLYPTITQARLDCYAKAMLTTEWTQSWAMQVHGHTMDPARFTAFTQQQLVSHVQTAPVAIQNRTYQGTQAVTFRMKPPLTGYVTPGPPVYTAVFGCQIQLADASGSFVVPVYIDQKYPGGTKGNLPVGSDANASVIKPPDPLTGQGGQNIIDSAPVVYVAL
jgi:hypothetical protein